MMKNHKPIDDPEYCNHRIFSDAKNISEFYRLLSFSVFGYVSIGSGASCNIDSYLFSSIQGSVESITYITKNGRLNDAYTLLRKFYDSVIINIYTNLYLDDHVEIKNFDVKKIRGWIQGREKMPNYRDMVTYVKNHERTKSLNSMVFTDTIYKDIRNRCNDHTHYNFYQNALLNDNEIFLNDRLKCLNTLSRDFAQVFVLHLAYMFHLNAHYMMSSDYTDAMNVGLTPEPDSQYLVAPFVQEVFDNFLKSYRPDIARFIKANTNMQLN